MARLIRGGVVRVGVRGAMESCQGTEPSFIFVGIQNHGFHYDIFMQIVLVTFLTAWWSSLRGRRGFYWTTGCRASFGPQWAEFLLDHCFSAYSLSWQEPMAPGTTLSAGDDICRVCFSHGNDWPGNRKQNWKPEPITLRLCLQWPTPALSDIFPKGFTKLQRSILRWGTTISRSQPVGNTVRPKHRTLCVFHISIVFLPFLMPSRGQSLKSANQR